MTDQEAQDDALLEAIAERRADKNFAQRLAALMCEDAPILARLANDDDEPFVVEPGWVRSVFIPHIGGPSYRVLFYADGSARFEHRCDRGARGTIICAPLLQLPDGHRVVQDEPLTIKPSIECGDCGTHGFITEGRWR